MSTTQSKVQKSYTITRAPHCAGPQHSAGQLNAFSGVPTLASLGPSGTATEVPYSPRAASVLATIASWAYSDAETLLDELAHRGIVGPDATCEQISVSNEAMLVVATAFLIRSGNVGVLCFRGTEPRNAVNFLTDVNVKRKYFLSMGRVHGGFHRNVRAVWFDIFDHVREAMADSDETRALRALYVTGHSLGGAMAVIAAAKIFGDEACASWRRLVQGVYTYGQPMVGDNEFAKSSTERFGHILFRHVYGGDLVPRLPPLSTGRFEHFGTEYSGSAEGWIPRSKPVRQIATISLSLPIGILEFILSQIPALSWLRLPVSIGDHSPNNYLEGFRAAR